MGVLAWIVAVGGAVGSIGLIYRTVVRPIVKWAVRLDKTMSFVESQMIPNGGTSLRDSVNRIEARLVQVEDLITKPK